MYCLAENAKAKVPSVSIEETPCPTCKTVPIEAEKRHLAAALNAGPGPKKKTKLTKEDSALAARLQKAMDDSARARKGSGVAGSATLAAPSGAASSKDRRRY